VPQVPAVALYAVTASLLRAHEELLQARVLS
jgi:hypothetical protein